MLYETTAQEAAGWDISQDAGYTEHELSQAIRAVADQARQDRARLYALGSYPNSPPATCVQDALKTALNRELYEFGLRVVRRPNWRGGMWS